MRQTNVSGPRTTRRADVTRSPNQMPEAKRRTANKDSSTRLLSTHILSNSKPPHPATARRAVFCCKKETNPPKLFFFHCFGGFFSVTWPHSSLFGIHLNVYGLFLLFDTTLSAVVDAFGTCFCPISSGVWDWIGTLPLSTPFTRYRVEYCHCLRSSSDPFAAALQDSVQCPRSGPLGAEIDKVPSPPAILECPLCCGPSRFFPASTVCPFAPRD